MSKKILTLGILLVVLAGVFVAPVGVSADLHTAVPLLLRTTMGMGFIEPSILNPVFAAFAKGTGQILMTITSLILTLSGMTFDWIVKFTIIDMAKNMNDPTGVGGSITTAWETLRDVANMFFIFVLLWTAFNAMFELNFASVGTAIRNIIIVALLINFSLFFSKVVIDASNIVAVGFYKSIIENSASLGGSSTIGTTTEYKGSISAGYMNMLGIQTLFGANILTGQTDPITILVIGFMSAIIMLVVAVILLIAGIMFAARFIILIFLMILSPLALIAFIVPAMASHFTTWKDALISQSFFAPLYFAMTWVVFKLGKSLLVVLSDPGLSQVAGANQVKVFSNIVSNPASSMAMLVNYVLIIGFSIAALVFSKMMASSTAGFSAITNAMGANKVAGVVGGVSLGGAAAVGRRTIGAAASRLAESQGLSRWAARSAFGQKVKEGIEKTSKSSFDIRQTKAIGGALQSTPMGSFGTGKAGGYDATLATQIAKKEKVATGLKTDQARQTYAARQLRGLSSYARGGSAPGHIWSVAGTMGRSNRIVASKILNDQITKLRTDLNAGNTELTRYQGVLRGGGALNPTQLTRYNDLIAPAIGTPGGVANSLADLHLQMTNIQTQINTLGITNPTNTTRSGRPMRADEQNY